MSYRAFAFGTVLAAPVLVMVVQSFTAERHDERQEASAPLASMSQPVAADPIARVAETPPPVQEAPSGPTPVFGQPLAGAGQPSMPLGNTPPSGALLSEADNKENF